MISRIIFMAVGAFIGFILGYIAAIWRLREAAEEIAKNYEAMYEVRRVAQEISSFLDEQEKKIKERNE